MESLALIKSDKDNLTIKADSEALIADVANITVIDEPSCNMANAVLGKIRVAARTGDKRRKSITDPMNAEVKEVKAWFDQFINPLIAADKAIERKILDWRAKERERAEKERRELERKAIEAQKEADRIAIEAKKLAEQGKKEDAEIVNMYANDKVSESSVQALAAINVAAPVKTMVAVDTKSSTSMHWTFEIIDHAKVPREYCMPQQTLINAAIKIGVREIAGVRIYQEERLTVRNNH